MKITKYPSVEMPQDSDVIPIVQGGETKKITVQLLMTKAPAASGEERITALEDKYVKATWFESIAIGTIGTLTPPEGGTILLDQWAAGVDALASIEAGGIPGYESPRTAGGDIVTATLDASGNWSLSGTPSAYPVDLIFAYEVKLKDFDHDKSIGEVEIIPSAGSVNVDSSGFSGFLTAAEKDVQSALDRIDSEGVGHSLAQAESDFLVASGSPLRFVRKTIDQVKTLLGVASSLPTPQAQYDVLMGDGSPLGWVKKTIAELKAALGLGTAAYTASTAYDAAGSAASAASSAVSAHESAFDHGALEGLGSAAYTESSAYDSAGAATAAAGPKADKVAASPSPAGHLAGLDASGNLTDSGNSPDDFAGSAHNHNLADLAEKSYNNLDDKPTIPAAAPDPTAANDFQVAGGSPLSWEKKTLAETQAILQISPLSPTLSTDHTANGLKFTGTAGENLAFGSVCYLKSDGKYWKTDADAATTMPCRVMALGSIDADASGSFLRLGFARDDSWQTSPEWTKGASLYPSTDAGGITTTAPSGSGDQVQEIGHVYSAAVIFFDPSPIVIEVA